MNDLNSPWGKKTVSLPQNHVYTGESLVLVIQIVLYLMYIGHSESNASYLFFITDTKSMVTLFDSHNSQLQNIIFNIITTIINAFSLAVNKSLCARFFKICTSRGVAVATAETSRPTPYCTHIRKWMVSINVQQATLNVNECKFFCFICTSISGTILSDCSWRVP